MPGGIHPPIKVIMTWPRPNFTNPETRPNTIAILACILGPITTAMLLARLWVRLIHQRRPGWDDWIMLIATVPILVLTVLYPLAAGEGFNKHIWDLNPIAETSNVVRLRKFILVAECIFCVASGLIKISILLFYRRISTCTVSVTFRRVTWLSIGFIATYSVTLTLVPILGCQPISAFWDQFNAHKILQGYRYHCFDEGANVFAASVISAAQDLITAMLPTLLYWNLCIPLRQKFALFGMFTIGYSGVAVGAVRAYFSWRIFYETYDVTWSTWDLMLTSLLELHIGAFCANAPALKVLFQHFFHKRASSRLLEIQPMNSPCYQGGFDDSPSSRSKKSIFSKFITLPSRSNSCRGTSRSFSGSYNFVSAGGHCGVTVGNKRASDATRSIPSTTRDTRASASTDERAYDQYHEDIELGSYHPNSVGSSFSGVLAEVSESPLSLTDGRANLLHSAPSKPSTSQLLTMKDLPRLPSPIDTPRGGRSNEAKRQQKRPISGMHVPWPEWQM